MGGESDVLFENLPPRYRTMPTSQNIDDRRQSPADYAAWMKRRPLGYPLNSTGYAPSPMDGAAPSSAQVTSSGPRPGYGFGANISQNQSSSLPPIDSHLPISPGEPGWTTPPSLSGPHSPYGDVPLPGYNRSTFPLDRFSPDQIQSALQLWQGKGS